MTNSILALLSSPTFPQPLTQIARVDRILAQSELVACCADRCRERATVEEIETGLEFCLMHFEEADRG